MASIRTGAVAAERKVAKYMALGRSHSFTPVAIETLGAIGPKSLAFIRDLGYRMKQSTVEERALTYMLQRLSAKEGTRLQQWERLETILPSCSFVSLLFLYFFIILFY